MRLAVHWETTYRYSEPVHLLHTELRVAPTERFGQKVHRVAIDTDPRAKVATAEDAFGNSVHHFDVLARVESVRMAMHADVTTGGGVIEQPELSPLERHLMSAPTHRSPFVPAIQRFVDDAGDGEDAITVAERIDALMAERFVFEVGRTDVEDTATELLELRHGVCQDFSHLMLAALRLRGIPARYVSGYLASPGGTAEGDASHAWVQVWSRGAWHGFDPANHQRQDEHYVVIGVGRDYDDVTPVRGSFRGSASEDWHAAVRVQSHETQQE